MSTLDAGLSGAYGLFGRRVTLRISLDSTYNIETGAPTVSTRDLVVWAIVRSVEAREVFGNVEAGDQVVAVQAPQLKGTVPTTKDTLFLFPGNPASIVKVEPRYEGHRVVEYLLTARAPRGR